MGARYEYLFKRSIILHCVKRFSFVTFLSKGLVSIICGQFYSCVFIGLVLMINGLFNSGEEKKQSRSLYYLQFWHDENIME